MSKRSKSRKSKRQRALPQVLTARAPVLAPAGMSYQLPAGSSPDRQPPGPANPMVNVISGEGTTYKYTQQDLDDFYTQQYGWPTHVDTKAQTVTITATCTADQPFSMDLATSRMQDTAPPKGYTTEFKVNHAMHGTGRCMYCASTERVENRVLTVQGGHVADTGIKLPEYVSLQQAREIIALAMERDDLTFPAGTAVGVIDDALATLQDKGWLDDALRPLVAEARAAASHGTPEERRQVAAKLRAQKDNLLAAVGANTTEILRTYGATEYADTGTPAYVLRMEDDPGKVMSLVQDVLPLLDQEGRVPETGYLVVVEYLGKAYRIRDFVRMYYDTADAPTRHALGLIPAPVAATTLDRLDAHGRPTAGPQPGAPVWVHDIQVGHVAYPDEQPTAVYQLETTDGAKYTVPVVVKMGGRGIMATLEERGIATGDPEQEFTVRFGGSSPEGAVNARQLGQHIVPTSVVPPAGSKVYSMDGKEVGRVGYNATGQAIGRVGNTDIVSTEGMTPEIAMDYGITPDTLREVQQSGQPMVIQEDLRGQLHKGVGERAVQRAIQRQHIVDMYAAHPLVMRYHQEIKYMHPPRNTAPWHAIAEQYAQIVMAANMGLGDGPAYLDPELKGYLGQLSEEDVGMWLASQLEQAVPYLWLQRIAEECDQLPLPAHTITRAISMPHNKMYWSFEVAHGAERARIDWVLVQRSDSGLEIWCPIVDDRQGHQNGTEMITALTVRWGSRWPDDYPQDRYVGGLVGFVLRRLAFLASKYVETHETPSPRHIRKQVARDMKPKHKPMPESLAAYVVELRAGEVKPVHHVAATDGTDRPGRNYQHRWWVRAHNMVWRRGTANEQVVYQPAHIKGPAGAPMLKKAYEVGR